jgi:hypothetical protein
MHGVCAKPAEERVRDMNARAQKSQSNLDRCITIQNIGAVPSGKAVLSARPDRRPRPDVES